MALTRWQAVVPLDWTHGEIEAFNARGRHLGSLDAVTGELIKAPVPGGRLMSDFIQQCLSHEAGPDDIDDFIDQWHDYPNETSLYEFLGMTKREYALWVVDSSVLPTIVEIRANNKRLDDLLKEVSQQLPTEATSSDKALINWLIADRPWEQPAVR